MGTLLYAQGAQLRCPVVTWMGGMGLGGEMEIQKGRSYRSIYGRIHVVI